MTSTGRPSAPTPQTLAAPRGRGPGTSATTLPAKGVDRMVGAGARRAELAIFLRTQRARLHPSDVGLPPDPVPGRRRTPGLRREEVAQLSGVGVTWYTWLEQGRNITASGQVVDALARALRLDADQRGHLRSLAGLAPDVNHAPAA